MKSSQPPIFSCLSFLLVLSVLSSTHAVQTVPVKLQPLKSLEKSTLQLELKPCDFYDERKDHSVSDLIRCADDLAADSLPPMTRASANRLAVSFENFQKSFAQSNGRQGYGLNDFPYDQQRPGLPFYRPGGPNSYGPYGNQGPYEPSESLSSGLAEALNSISQYDDLKCVPRLLCEVATGSKPGKRGSGASNLADFGKNTLLGLLTSYDLDEASPLLAFGKAALLGYTSRGDSSVCYNEYFECPTDPRDLVHYLNNHNGGFFRFFKTARGRPAAPQGSNRVGHSLKPLAPPPGLSGPESDRTGTGNLKFDTPEPSARQDGDKNGYHYSRVIFPTDDKELPYRERRPKSLKRDDSKRFFPTSDSANIITPFFPSDKSNVVFESSEDIDHQTPYFRDGRLLTTDLDKQASSVFTFPDQEEARDQNDSPAKLIPGYHAARDLNAAINADD